MTRLTILLILLLLVSASVSPAALAKDKEPFWSFQAIVRPELPKVRDRDWVKNPIDAFVLDKLEAAGLRPAPPADRLELLRRVTYGLTGLPPALETVDEFLSDPSESAFERVVRDLLASDQYGVHWGRHWLDVVRYAESNSFERDSTKPSVWRYRDYVIDAFNKDKPYDQFIREQLAGDELEDYSNETLIATGFYRLGQWDDEPTDKLQARYDELDDILTTTGQAFLGLTVNCARCHDHKLDPIPQVDYYRMLSFFEPITSYSYKTEKILRDISPPELRTAYEAEKAIVDAKAAVLEAEMKKVREKMRARASESQRQKLANGGRKAKAVWTELETSFPEAAEAFNKLRTEHRKIRNTKIEPALDFALAVLEREGEVPASFVRVRGNANVKGPEVRPGFPSALNPPEPEIHAPPNGKSSGRRLALANWMVSRENPLTARVMVNRIWQHHFGRGIVTSPNDYGKIGARPTHPELLDWLASEFMDRGWSIKAMHRLILSSNTYQMSSRGDSEALAKDPENLLFWRMNMRRLQAEEIRDSVLAANGKLNLRMGGPSMFTVLPEAVLQTQSQPGKNWGDSPDDERARRSVYIHVKRSLITPMMATFDFADTDTSCPVRFATTQPTQALTMLNSEFINHQASVFAERLVREAGPDRARQVRLALGLAFSRKPTATEVENGVRLMENFINVDAVSAEVALERFCLMVLNLNEFVYLD